MQTARHEWRWPDEERLALLVREAQREKIGAVDRLLTAIRPALVQFFAARMTDDSAEDWAQDALIRVSAALWRIDPARAGVYIRTVARNLARTAYKRRSDDLRKCDELSSGQPHRAFDSPDSVLEYEELVSAIHRVAAARLAPPLADIVVGLVRGETAPEIARRQGVSPVTVRTRLVRARAILRQELGHCLSVGTSRDSG